MKKFSTFNLCKMTALRLNTMLHPDRIFYFICSNEKRMLNRLWLIVFLLFPALLSAIPDVSVNIHRFRTGTESFAEVSLYIVGSSLTYEEGKHSEYGVEYTILIKDKENAAITGDHYRLTNEGFPLRDLIDVKRFILVPGSYTVEIEMTDINDSLSTIIVLQQTEIEAGDLAKHLSDIQLHSVIKNEAEGSSPLHKSGLYLEPLLFSYYYLLLDKLNVYVETYDMEKVTGQPYLQYTIKPSVGDILSPVVAHRKVSKQPVSANVFQFDIKDLISGPYTIEAALFDGNKNLIISRQVSFSRFNPTGDSIFLASGSLNLDASFIKTIPVDSLDYYLRAMTPVVSSIHADIMNSILAKGNTKTKQFFIHRYWTEQAGKFADQAFASYMKVARAIDEL